MRKLRLAYLVTHPIPYQAPLLRLIAAEPDIDMTVFFGTDFSARPFTAGEFRTEIKWDTPLLEGYRHEVLPQVFAPAPGQLPPLDFWRPVNYGLAERLNHFDVLWIHGYAHWFHWTAMSAARRRGLKVLMRDEATSISTARSPVKRAAKRAFFTWLDRMVDAFLAIGTLNRRYYAENGIGAGRVFDMPYAVDNAHFSRGAAQAAAHRERTRAEFGLERGRPILLFAAKLIERKRPELLLEAFSRIHNDPALQYPYLVFAGDGPQREVLESRARRTAPGAVRFLGFQKQSDLPRCYDLCDAFVLPSVQESWGLVVNEVMCAGRAVVVSDRIGAGADLVHPGENGAIFRTDDVDDLTRILRGLLKDPQGLAAMGQRSRQIIQRWSFSEDVAGLRQALAAVVPSWTPLGSGGERA